MGGGQKRVREGEYDCSPLDICVKLSTKIMLNSTKWTASNSMLENVIKAINKRKYEFIGTSNPRV